MTTPIDYKGRGRTLHLVDLENLLGARRTEEVALHGLQRYLALARWAPGDQMVVAADPQIVRQIAFEPPVPWSLHATRGDDAADVMLLANAPVELVTRRYARLVVGSGDGIFVARAREVRERGVGVVVIAPPEGVAARFRRWAFPVIEFHTDTLVSTVARSVARAA